MLIALTGTPGVGKSTVAGVLSGRGVRVIEVSDFARERGLLGDRDPDRDTFDVDIDLLDEEMGREGMEGTILLVGHLAHLLTVDLAIVLRCSPSLLEERMRSRGWSDHKIRENMEAEACDVILVETLDSEVEVCEIDTTPLSPEEVAEALEDIIQGEREKYEPGHIDWSEEVLDWY